MDWLIEKLNSWTGRRFWYAVTLFYYIDNGETGSNIHSPRQIGLTRKNEILKSRVLKRRFAGWIKTIKKEHLKNGTFEIEIISYLGWFKRSEAKIK